MEQIIYSEFSNDRNPKFSMMTEIGVKDNEKIRRKIPCSLESIPHVKGFHQRSKKIRADFEKHGVSVSRCWMEGDIAYFDDISGETFASRLDALMIAEDKEGFVEAIRQYIAKVDEIYDTVPFQSSEAFRQVFGKVEFEEEMASTEDLAIDFIFSNIVEKDGEWVLMNYEWLFDFLVPIQYLYYLAAHSYLLHSRARERFYGGELRRAFGISKSQWAKLQKMDEHFQNQFIQGSHRTLEKMYDEFGKRRVPIISELNDGKAQVDKDDGFLVEDVIEVQVYADDGSGYTRENSKTYVIAMDKDKKAMLELECPENLSRIQMTLGGNACAVSILECVNGEEPKQNMEFTTNGIKGDQNYFVFLTKEPQIYIDLNNQPAKKIKLVMEVDFIHKKINQWLSDYLERPNTEKNIFATLERLNQECLQVASENRISEKKVKELQAHIEMLSEKYHQEIANITALQNSTSWKVTKPLRAIMGLVKR